MFGVVVLSSLCDTRNIHLYRLQYLTDGGVQGPTASNQTLLWEFYKVFVVTQSRWMQCCPNSLQSLLIIRRTCCKLETISSVESSSSKTKQNIDFHSAVTSAVTGNTYLCIFSSHVHRLYRCIVLYPWQTQLLWAEGQETFLEHNSLFNQHSSNPM